ncbi:MAG: trypsin-like peptidase domain-containing protein [Candidatus Acidiferrales bacterium]
MVHSEYGWATIFALDVDGREYWITAKHVLTGAEHPPYGAVNEKTVKLELLDPSSQVPKWIPEEFAVIDTAADVDIVVLATSIPLLNKPGPIDAGDGEVIGGECEFLGYPYGNGYIGVFDTGQRWWLPFVKHAYVSAVIHDPVRVMILDGINNPGFSGGPVIIGSLGQQRIVGVISGYQTDLAAVVPTLAIAPQVSKSRSKQSKTSAAEPLKEGVRINNGFIIAYPVAYALEAIHKNPIGALRITAVDSR